MKKDKLLQVRMTKEELEGLQALVDELSRKGYQETTVSGLTRQALEKWEHVYGETEAGNYMTILKTNQLGKDGLQEFLNGLADLQHKAKNPALKRLLDDLRTNLFLHAGEILEAGTRNKEKQKILRKLNGGGENV